MIRWSIILLLLVGALVVSIWGAVKLSRPVPVVNQPITPEQREQVAPPASVLIIPPASPATGPAQPQTPVRPPPTPPGFPLVYGPDGTIGEAPVFQKALTGLAVDRKRNILYAAGDGEIKSFGLADGRFIRRFRTRRPPLSVSVDQAGDIYVGEGGRVEKYNREGRRLAKIGDRQVGEVTAVAVGGGEVLAGDATARRIRRFEATGQYKHLGDVPPGKIDLVPEKPPQRLILPNKMLDFAIGPGGELIVANPGRHAVQTYDRAGKRLSDWGRFDQRDPKGFPGCCNPVNLAVLPLAGLGAPSLGGTGVVTAEKTIARVKVYDSTGRLLAVIEPKHFNQRNTRMDLAVDGSGRIYVADTTPRVIRRFAPRK